MKKLSVIVAMLSFAIAGSAFAQNSADGITRSTDPSKAAAVERHAAEIKAHQQSASTTSAKPSVRHSHHVKKHHVKHHAKHHGKKHHAKKVAMK